MVDPLRQNINRFLDEIKHPLLEREDLLSLLDGRVDEVVKKHNDEDKVFNVKKDWKKMGDPVKISEHNPVPLTTKKGKKSNKGKFDFLKK